MAERPDFETFLQQRSLLAPMVSEDEEEDWKSKLSKISPVLQGVTAVVGFIQGIKKSQEEAQFRHELLSSLQQIQTQLSAIKTALDNIFNELKNIETAIVGLGLNDKLTAIETWGQNMNALDPSDSEGAKHLAAGMMDARLGASNLLGCMNGLHDAMVGKGIGTPILKLLGADSFLRLRARLLQGLHLLAFATAFNPEEKYDFGVYLLEWSQNFEQQLQIYFQSGNDSIPSPLHKPDVQEYPGYLCKVTDTIVVFRHLQSSLDNVALMVQGTGQLIHGYSGLLEAWFNDQDKSLFCGFRSAKHEQAYFDLLKNLMCYADEKCSWVDEVSRKRDRFLAAFLRIALAGVPFNVFTERARLVCGARVNPAQTFLGAANGQMLWVDSSGDGATRICCIHDGSTTKSPLFVYDAASRTVSSSPLSSLHSLTPALWAVSWSARGVVTICPLMKDKELFLTVDSSGKPALSNVSSALRVVAAEGKLEWMASPETMTPTAATIGPDLHAASRTVLFHQF